MARRRERIALEDGLRLDLNALVGQGLKRDRWVVVGAITWGRRWASDGR